MQRARYIIILCEFIDRLRSPNIHSLYYECEIVKPKKLMEWQFKKLRFYISLFCISSLKTFTGVRHFQVPLIYKTAIGRPSRIKVCSHYHFDCSFLSPAAPLIVQLKNAHCPILWLLSLCDSIGWFASRTTYFILLLLL